MRDGEKDSYIYKQARKKIVIFSVQHNNVWSRYFLKSKIFTTQLIPSKLETEVRKTRSQNTS